MRKIFETSQTQAYSFSPPISNKTALRIASPRFIPCRSQYRINAASVCSSSRILYFTDFGFSIGGLPVRTTHHLQHSRNITNQTATMTAFQQLPFRNITALFVTASLFLIVSHLVHFVNKCVAINVSSRTIRQSPGQPRQPPIPHGTGLPYPTTPAKASQTAENSRKTPRNACFSVRFFQVSDIQTAYSIDCMYLCIMPIKSKAARSDQGPGGTAYGYSDGSSAYFWPTSTAFSSVTPGRGSMIISC